MRKKTIEDAREAAKEAARVVAEEAGMDAGMYLERARNDAMTAARDVYENVLAESGVETTDQYDGRKKAEDARDDAMDAALEGFDTVLAESFAEMGLHGR